MHLTLERKNFIGEVRQRAGVTQVELARRAGLSQSSISQIEQPTRQPDSTRFAKSQERWGVTSLTSLRVRSRAPMSSVTR